MNNHAVPAWEDTVSVLATSLSLDEAKVEEILNEYGIPSDQTGVEMLLDDDITPFGDLRHIFCEKNNVKLPLLRLALKNLRKNKDSSFVLGQFKLEPKTYQDLDTEDLIRQYDPYKKNGVHYALLERFKDKPVIIFDPYQNSVNVEETLKYITSLDIGYDETEIVFVNGISTTPAKIGEIPNIQVDEDPMFPGIPLRNGVSVKNFVSYENNSREIRQIIRLLVTNKDIDVNDKFAVKNLMTLINNGDADDESNQKALWKMFPETMMEYKRLESLNQLPSLKMELNSTNSKKVQKSIKQSYPFSIGIRG